MHVGVLNCSQSNRITLRYQYKWSWWKLTLDKPKTPKNAKLISNRAYQCQLTSQIQWNSYEKVLECIRNFLAPSAQPIKRPESTEISFFAKGKVGCEYTLFISYFVLLHFASSWIYLSNSDIGVLNYPLSVRPRPSQRVTRSKLCLRILMHPIIFHNCKCHLHTSTLMVVQALLPYLDVHQYIWEPMIHLHLAIIFFHPKFCQLPWAKVTWAPFLMNSWTVLDYHLLDKDPRQWVCHRLIIPLRCASYFFQSSSYHGSRQSSISNPSGAQRVRIVSGLSLSQRVLLSLTSCLCPSRVRPSILGRAL